MIALGLMSGTSCDGVDAAMIETDGISVQKFIAQYHLPYDADFQKKLLRLMQGHENWLDIEVQLTQYHADIVQKLHEITNIKSDIIGFHGQTIFHAPGKGICWQIGNPHLLASLTGIDVVADFRRRDVARKGQGAPLVPIFHKALMHNHKLPVAIVNIGGVANMTYIGKDDILIGCDVGPGNALINDAMMKYYGKPYDEGGAVARTGKFDAQILAQLMSEPFFQKLSPKSLDRNHFKGAIDQLKAHKHEDIIATLTMFTAATIATHLSQDYLQKMGATIPEVLYLCGGGGKNKAIVDGLQGRMPQTRVSHVEELGFDSEYVEAQAFAYLAARHLKGLPSSFPSTTGVNQATVSGVLFQA